MNPMKTYMYILVYFVNVEQFSCIWMYKNLENFE